MNNIVRMIRDHKKASMIGAFLLAIFLAFSATSACSVAHRRASEAATPAQTAASQEAASSSPSSSSDSESAPDNDDLTPEQKAAVDTYDDDTKKFVDILCASVWTDSSGNNTITFKKDGTYAESIGNSVTKHTYAITRLNKDHDQMGYEYDTAVFITDTGTHIASYSNIPQKDGSSKTTLSSDTMFASKANEYTRKDAVTKVTIKGLNSDMSNLYDGHDDKLVESVSTWCALHYPAVTTATWSQAASIDWKSSIISTQFSLDNTSNVNITVLYDMKNGTFNIN